MTTISVTQARKNLYRLLGELRRSHEPLQIAGKNEHASYPLPSPPLVGFDEQDRAATCKLVIRTCRRPEPQKNYLRRIGSHRNCLAEETHLLARGRSQWSFGRGLEILPQAPRGLDGPLQGALYGAPGRYLATSSPCGDSVPKSEAWGSRHRTPLSQME